MRLPPKKIAFYLLSFILLAALTGCATTPPPVSKPVAPIKPLMPGFYHKVERKETLWRISKKYNVDLDELAKINKINDSTSIEVGQSLFIPKTPAPKPAPIAPPSTAEKPRPVVHDDFIWPLRGKIINGFGQTSRNMVNKGIDIAPSKSSDIIASRSGKVVFYADNFLTYGKTVILDHGDGFSTIYSRNSEVTVKKGDYVQRGTVIAKVGSSVRDKNTYLHFEIRKGHTAQNPKFYLSN